MDDFSRKLGLSKIIIGPAKVKRRNLSARKQKMIPFHSTTPGNEGNWSMPGGQGWIIPKG